MKKKPQYQFNNPKTLITQGTANGEVTNWTMDPVSLAEWKRGLPARPDYEMEKKLNRSMMGGDIA